MRRRGWIISLLAAAVVLPVAVPGAGAAAAHRAILCPLDAAAVTPCCGPPIAGPARPAATIPCCVGADSGATPRCCPPNALCAAPFTIAATPTPSVAGRAVTVAGRVLRAATGTAVTLWRRPAAGSRTFVAARHTTTDSSGNYRFVLHPRTNDFLYGATGTARSANVRLQVQAVIGIHLRVRSGARMVLVGEVRPNHAGGPVVLQRLARDGAWLAVRHTRLDRRSRYRLIVSSRTLGCPGSYRIWLPADARNAASASEPLHAVC